MASIDIPKLYHFQFPMKPVSWKGLTLYQVVSRLRRVHNTNTNPKLFFLPNPVTKVYRREVITSTDKTTCHSRLSQSLSSVLEIPGGAWITNQVSKANSANGLVGLVEPVIPNSISERGNICPKGGTQCLSKKTTTDNVCFRPEINALRRCRSAGMNCRKFVNRDHAYFSDNKQYLHSRNRTVSQNEYTYIRQGNPVLTPGTSGTKSNVYSPNGLNHCPKYRIAAALGNNLLKYSWIDNTANQATIPDGEYDIFDLNNAFRNLQIANTYYYIQNANNVKIILLTLGFSTTTGSISVYCQDYTQLTGTSIKGGSWTPTKSVPQLVVGSGDLLAIQGLGLSPASYPATSTGSSASYLGYGQQSARLKPSYTPLYYKPSNPQYAAQGGVSSSARLLRKKYNEIQKAANTTTVFGQAVANSLAYDVPIPDYSTHLKAKTGYPMTATPIVCKYKNAGVQRRDKFIYR